jgi:hypothetical protein
MAILTTAYKERFGEMTKGDMDIWYGILQPLTQEQFENAVMQYTRTNHKPPTPALLFDIARKLDRFHISAEEVLRKVKELAQRGLTIPELQHELKEDPEALKAIDTIGWDRIKYGHIDEWPWIEKRFLESYRELRQAQHFGTTAEFLPYDRLKLIHGKIPDAKRIGSGPKRGSRHETHEHKKRSPE